MNKEAKTKELWDNSAASYSNAIQRQLLDGSREIWLDLILSNAPDKERLDVLDLGTGPGFFSIILALEGHRAVGIDASPLMLETARENARACGANAEFLQMNIQELATVYALNLPLKMIILDNQILGMVSQWEDQFYDGVHADTDMKVERAKRPYPDFV